MPPSLQAKPLGGGGPGGVTPPSSCGVRPFYYFPGDGVVRKGTVGRHTRSKSNTAPRRSAAFGARVYRQLRGRSWGSWARRGNPRGRYRSARIAPDRGPAVHGPSP